MIWKPHATVAAIIEKDSKFLMVEEICNGAKVINQPAGHLDDNETLIDAVIRETLEETAWHFNPTNITGIYQWKSTRKNQTFLRVCFTGNCTHYEQNQALDTGILQTLWMTRPEIEQANLRSPMVMKVLDDYLAGHRYPLNLLHIVT